MKVQLQDSRDIHAGFTSDTQKLQLPFDMTPFSVIGAFYECKPEATVERSVASFHKYHLTQDMSNNMSGSS